MKGRVVEVGERMVGGREGGGHGYVGGRVVGGRELRVVDGFLGW